MAHHEWSTVGQGPPYAMARKKTNLPHFRIHPPDDLCSLCQLDEFYDSVETLRALPQLQPFLKWIRRQPAQTSFKTHQASAHPDRRRRK